MNPIKNIIFDLGGVLLDIDYQKTTRAFIELGVKDFDSMFNQFHSDELFTRLETGSISEPDFFEQIRKTIPHPVSNEQIESAWNAMILKFRTSSLACLEELGSRYNIFLLSNTNSIHFRAFREQFTRETGKPDLDRYFRKAWYSHLVRLRKPERAIYEFVLGDAGISATETLFIDDSVNNINAAELLGIRTHLLSADERVEKLDWNRVAG